MEPEKTIRKEDTSTVLMEGVGRSILFKAIVYGLPVVYLTRLGGMIVAGEPGRTVILRAVRDCSVIQALFIMQRYMATYAARRSSFRDRRRDAWLIPVSSATFLCLNVPLIFGIPWLVCVAVLVPCCVVGYVVEIRRTERELRPT